jgi:hypothetical protein
MLRVKDGQEVDVISDASKVKDGHRKQKRAVAKRHYPLDVSPLV